jgi:ribonuclease-3 family protein
MFERVRKTDPDRVSSKTLAYIGDSVFELYSRLYVVSKHDDKISGLHKHNIALVNAGAQAVFARKIQCSLTEREITIFKRGRNINSGTMARNANAADYRVATGLESLIGYLFLANENDRLQEILKIIFDEIDQNNAGVQLNDT